MAQGNIEFIRPLAAAIERTRSGLFRPFRIETWVVVGFSAWLAWLGQHGSYGSGGNWDAGEIQDLPDLHHLLRGWLAGIRDFVEHWAVLVGIVALVGMILTVIVAFTWVSSRAKFVLLENVMQGHAKFVDPWSRHGALGWSLFWWRLVFGLVVLGFFGALAALWWFWAAVPFLDGNAFVLAPLIWITLLALPVSLVIAFLSCFLESFVVPIMFRHGLPANAAWGRFLGLFRERWGSFVLYALFLIPLWIFVGILILFFVLMTCCVGGLLLIIPYVGMVLQLPIYYTHRGFGPEFLAQFGPEWDSRPVPAPAPAPEPVS